MESNLERFLWLAGGFLLSILLQNFVNDPIRDWRAKRSKRLGKQRVEELRLELTRVEELAPNQGEVALSLVNGLYLNFYLLFFILEFCAGCAILSFSAQLFAISQGDTGLSPGLAILGGILSFLAFIFCDLLRRELKRGSKLSENILNFAVYKAKTEEHIRDLEKR